MSPSFKEKFGNYSITSISDLSEIKCTLIELEHGPTGAQIMQILSEDDENLFNLSFRTWPDKSNGVAHILEHTVLCGSEKYPIRDPFFGMSRRSLNTFMNALTGADFTCYPAASLVPKDFYNLLQVYLDAVFKPKLTKLSFLQEGHRLEFLKPDDPNSPLLIKGIVFNEMKGALSSGDARLSEILMQETFPNLTYGVNSGGDPKEIPNLTYEELKSFHAKFYHPSRCLFYFYGNLPLEPHLEMLERYAFNDVAKVPRLPALPKQPRFKEKVVKTKSYPVSAEEDIEAKALVGMSWLTCSILEQEELLALNVLDLVLMGTDAAPLKRALLKSNLCKQADSALENDMSEIPFILVCKGCAEENGPKLEELVFSTLKQLVKEGLPENLIEGSIHQLEMSRTEITGHSAPYGLSLFFRSALLKQHGGKPEDGLRIHTLFNQLRKKVKDPRYLPSLIEKYFLKNTHFVRIDLLPDKKLMAKEIEEEQNKLFKIVEKLDDNDVRNILKQAKELSEYQEDAKEEDLDVLPTVELRDVTKMGKEFPLIQEKVSPFKLFSHPCFTNELVYVDLIFDLPEIHEQDLSYLRLFTLLLPQLGSGGRTYAQHLEYLLEHTGGLAISLDLGLQAKDPTKMSPFLNIKGKALRRKMDKLFPIIRDMVSSADFSDTGRIGELLKQHYLGLENSIHHSSLRYAVNLAARGLSVPSKIINSWYGLDYFWALKEIVSGYEKDPKQLVSKLKKLQEFCLNLDNPHLVLGCDDEAYSKLKANGLYGLQKLNVKPFASFKGNYAVPKTESQGRVTVSPVAFTALLFPSVSYVHPDAPSLSIASQIMENKILHMRIREQGGAYGSGAVNGMLSGQFYFYSYRDPHIVSTLNAFQEAVDYVAQGNFDEEDLVEAKLGLFQDLDAPVTPGSRAITAYSRLRGGRTPELRQKFRDELFSKEKKDIQKATEAHLSTGIKNATIVSFASKELLEKENALLKEKALPIYPI